MRSERPERTRSEGAAQWALVVLLGVPLYILLVTATDDPQGLFGTQDTITAPVGILLALQGLGGVLLWLGPAAFGYEPSRVLRVLVALLPVSLLLRMWPLAWHLATIGGLCCLVQGCHLGHAAPVAEDRPARVSRFRTVALVQGDAGFALTWRLAAGLAMLVLLVTGHGIARTPLAWAAVSVYAGLALLVGLAQEFGQRAGETRSWQLGLGVLLLAGLVAGWVPAWRGAALPLLGARQVLAALRLWHRQGGSGALWARLARNPAGLLALSFALAIVGGALVLDLPAAAGRGGVSIGMIDALFTAASAICVTGLTTVDTGTAFSHLGQAVILLLIQVGGLGVMTVSMVVALLLGRDLGIASESALAEMLGEDRNRLLRNLLRFIVATTLGTELLGAAVLTWGFFQQGMAAPASLYYGIFHSVSAFCNAGFALLPDSFVGYAGVPLFPLTLSALIAAGGLGFGVLHGLAYCRGARARGVPLPPHVRLMLYGSGGLWLGGMVCFWLAERHGVLAGRPWPEALVNAWFQSVTARTAGFNTVDLRALSPVTDLLLRGLMFIGAGPGSTAGGIKVTTAAVLVLLVIARIRGRHHAVLFGRRLDETSTINAVTIAVLASGVVAAAAALLLATQPLGPGLTPSMLTFEAISAFGTVGLSLGATPQLNAFGKLVIIVAMFVGRVGPLTLLVMMRPRGRSTVDYPEVRIMVG